MGFRNYIGALNKEHYNTLKIIKDFESLEALKGEDKTSPYKLVDKSLHELGKYVDEFEESLTKPFFLNDKMQEDYTVDYDLVIVGKEFMKAVIERYSSKVEKIYEEMCIPFFGDRFDSSEFLKTIKRSYDDDLEEVVEFDFSKITPAEVNAMWRMLNHIRSMRFEWSKGQRPYALGDGTDVITDSWKFEYAQFELVRIYKTFDWEKDVMVYYGY